MLFRSRLGPSVRSGPDGPRARDDHRDLPVRLRRVPTLHPQDRAGPYGDRSHATQDRGRHIMKRKVDYTWRLAELMAARGLHNRSEEHTSELQSLMRISYAVFCLQKKTLLYITQHNL